MADSLTTFDRSQIDAAQEALANATIAVALDVICEKIGDAPLKNSFVPYQDGAGVRRDPQQVKAELYKALTDTESQYLRLRRLNLIARENHVDLSMKSNGRKSEASTRDKMERRHLDFDGVTDLARLTVVSGDLALIDDYAGRLQKRIHDEHHPAEGHEEMEPWQMRERALLHKVLKTQVAGVNSEVQFVPRQQARVSTRVTYKLSRVDRDMDLLEELQKSGGTAAGERKATLISEYNILADVLHRLISKPALTETDLQEVNKALASEDYSQFAFDEESEGATTSTIESKSRKFYSPMFKTLKDMQTYSDYLREMAPKLGIAELAPLQGDAGQITAEQLQGVRRNVRALAQATHFCYMKEAPEAMRNLFIEKAYELNAIKGKDFIPKALIDTVPHTVKPLAEGRDGPA